MTVEDALAALCQANDEAGRPHDTGIEGLLKEAVNSGLDFYEDADWDSMRLAEIISAAELDPVVLRFALENGFDPERYGGFLWSGISCQGSTDILCYGGCMVRCDE